MAHRASSKPPSSPARFRVRDQPRGHRQPAVLTKGAISGWLSMKTSPSHKGSEVVEAYPFEPVRWVLCDPENVAVIHVSQADETIKRGATATILRDVESLIPGPWSRLVVGLARCDLTGVPRA